MKAFGFACLSAVIASSALAHDHLNLERGIPTQVEDSLPTAEGNYEVQATAAFVQKPGSVDQWNVQPRIEWGFARDWQLELSAPFKFGEGDRSGSGDIEIEAFYHLNWETSVLPSFALKGGLTAPTGKESSGVDPDATLILTKTLPGNTFFHRIHFNAKWMHEAQASASERSDRYRFVLGYQVRLDPNNMLVLDALRELGREKNQSNQLAEAGLRHQWDPLTVIAIGGAVGLGSDSDRWRATLGFQRALNFY